MNLEEALKEKQRLEEQGLPAPSVFDIMQALSWQNVRVIE